MENIKLAQLNAAYLSKISDLEENKKEKFVEVKKEVHETENTEILRFHNRISYLEMKLKNSEEKEAELMKQVDKLQRREIELEETIVSI